MSGDGAGAKPRPHAHNKRAKYHEEPQVPKKVPATAIAGAFKGFVGALYVDQVGVCVCVCVRTSLSLSTSLDLSLW